MRKYAIQYSATQPPKVPLLYGNNLHQFNFSSIIGSVIVVIHISKIQNVAFLILGI